MEPTEGQFDELKSRREARAQQGSTSEATNGEGTVVNLGGEAADRAREKLSIKSHNAGEHDDIRDDAADAVRRADFYLKHMNVVQKHYDDVNSGRLPAVDPKVVKINRDTGKPYTVEEVTRLANQQADKAISLNNQVFSLMDKCPSCRSEYQSGLEQAHANGYHHPTVEGPHDYCPTCIAQDEEASKPKEPVTPSPVTDITATRAKKIEEENDAKRKENDDKTMNTMLSFKPGED